jgi:protein-S-isoprenylcysteine O-methyltransferase Ste14
LGGALVDRLVHEGAGLAGALARRRVTLGFVFGALVLWLAQPTASTLLIGAAIGMVGEGLRVWAAGHLNKAREVTMSGPYRWIGHPLYVGSSVIGVGLAVASASVAVTALIAVYLVATLTAAVKSEEAFLRRTFGDRYDRYQRGDVTSPDPVHFSLQRALGNHEHRALVGFLLAVLLLVLKATYNGVF